MIAFLPIAVVFAMSVEEVVPAQSIELACKVVPLGASKAFALSADLQMSGGGKRDQTAIVTARSGSKKFPSTSGVTAKVSYSANNIAGVHAEQDGQVFEYIFDLPTRRNDTFVGTALVEIWSEPSENQRPLAAGICSMKVSVIEQ